MVVKNDGKYIFNDLAQSPDVWTVINGQTYAIILDSVSVDETDRNMLTNIELKADRATTYTKREVDDIVETVKIDDTKLATKEELQSLRDTEVQRALMKSDTAQNVALAAEDKIKDLRTYVDEQIGGIDTMTDDILA